MKKFLSVLLSFSCFAIFNLHGADNNNESMVRFFVKTLNGQHIEKIKSKASTIKSLLKDLSKNHGRSKGILLFNGKQLEREKTLFDYDINTETNVQFVSRDSVSSYSAFDTTTSCSTYCGSTSNSQFTITISSDDELSDWSD